MSMSETPSVADICNRLGRAKLATAVGVGLTAVANAVAENRFPARWFFVVRALCDQAEIQCPETLFNFILISTSEDAA